MGRTGRAKLGACCFPTSFIVSKFPYQSRLHRVDMLLCSTSAAARTPFLRDCPGPSRCGWEGLSAISWADYLGLTSQKGKKLTLLMFTRLLLLKKDSPSLLS